MSVYEGRGKDGGVGYNYSLVEMADGLAVCDLFMEVALMNGGRATKVKTEGSKIRNISVWCREQEIRGWSDSGGFTLVDHRNHREHLFDTKHGYIYGIYHSLMINADARNPMTRFVRNGRLHFKIYFREQNSHNQIEHLTIDGHRAHYECRLKNFCLAHPAPVLSEAVTMNRCSWTVFLFPSAEPSDGDRGVEAMLTSRSPIEKAFSVSFSLRQQSPMFQHQRGEATTTFQRGTWNNIIGPIADETELIDSRRGFVRDGWAIFDFVFDFEPVEERPLQPNPPPSIPVRQQSSSELREQEHRNIISCASNTPFDRNCSYVEIVTDEDLKLGYALDDIHTWDREGLRTYLLPKETSLQTVIHTIRQTTGLEADRCRLWLCETSGENALVIGTCLTEDSSIMELPIGDVSIESKSGRPSLVLYAEIATSGLLPPVGDDTIILFCFFWDAANERLDFIGIVSIGKVSLVVDLMKKTNGLVAAKLDRQTPTFFAEVDGDIREIDQLFDTVEQVGLNCGRMWIVRAKETVKSLTELEIKRAWSVVQSRRTIPASSSSDGTSRPVATQLQESFGGSDVGKAADRRDLCVVCLENAQTHAFLHGDTCHLCVCEACSVRVCQSARRCIVCQAPSNTVIRVYGQ